MERTLRNAQVQGAARRASRPPARKTLNDHPLQALGDALGNRKLQRGLSPARPATPPSDALQLYSDCRGESAGSGCAASPSGANLQKREGANSTSGRPASGAAVDRAGRSAHGIADAGLRGASGSLPYLDRIQKSFGRHDLADVQASVGGEARTANERLGALAYTQGRRIAFKESPDLRLTAHEAAHAVQQSQGVQLKGGLGRLGDRHEQKADRVADQVVAGRSAEAMLDAGAQSLRPRATPRTGYLQRAPDASSPDDNACFMPDDETAAEPAEPQECSFYGPAKAAHPAEFDPCAVNVSSLSNYEVLAELNAALERVGLGEDSEGFFDWRNLGRRLQAEVARRAQAGHIWMQAARGEIPGTLVRVSDNPIDGSMVVARVPGSTDAGEGWDIHLTPMMTEEQFQELLGRQQIETIRIEEYRRQMAESRLAAMSSTMVTGGRLYNTALDPRLIDPFSRPSLSASGRPIQKGLGRLGEAGYESPASSGFGFGVNDLNANPWMDRRGRVHQPGEENFPVFDFENAPAFARVLGTARVSVKTSGQATQAGRFEYYRSGMSQMYQTGGRSGLPSYISNQPQFAGQPTTGPQYEANRSDVLSDAYIAVNRDDAAAFRDLLSDPGGRETATGPTLWEDTGFQPGQRPRASWRAVYEGVMREEPVRVNGVDYNSPNALDQARQAGQIDVQDYELARREVGRRAARRVVAHGASTLDLVNLRTARPSLNAIPDAQLPRLLTPEHMRALRAGPGIGGEFEAAGGAGVHGGGAGGLIAVVTTAGVMLFDEADHPDWERELGTAGTLGLLGGATGSTTEQLLISGGTRALLNDAAAGAGGSILTRGLVTTGGRFGGGGVGAGVVELVSMGFFEDRSHSGLEYTERTGRAFVIGGTSAVIGAEAGAGATVFTTALVGAAAGSEVPVIGNIIGFIVGLGVGAFVYYEADKRLPGGRADWDEAEAARQEGCRPRPREIPRDDSERAYHCFARDTQVHMADGSTIAVQGVRPGDRVLGYDVLAQRAVAARVVRTSRHGPSACMRILLTDGAALRVTANHPVALSLDSSVRWVEAGALRAGQELVVLDPANLSTAARPIAAIEHTGEQHEVFDLTIAVVHNVFVDRILAHNKMM